tara:strand:- start:655 stop:1413 length:759 start_codon:yes stop_codon:yes gene_type:complete
MSLSGTTEGLAGLIELNRAANQYSQEAFGFAEILVQHAPHETRWLKYAGLDLDLKSERVTKAIDLVLDRKAPVILHLELNDYEPQSEMIIQQLGQLLARYPNHDFVLMHMAQATPEEARNLVESHASVHFMTSTADAFASFTVAKAGTSHKAQVGWINLFSALPDGAPYKSWLADYLPVLEWDERWKSLIEAHSDRFVFAADNVFGPHWTKRYPAKLKLWRHALSLLTDKTARMMACANAKRLWKLEMACGS